MALQLNKSYNYHGIIIPSLYSRVEYTVDITSTFIISTIHFFIDKTLYESDPGIKNSIYIPELLEYVSNKIDYNPTVDGTDIITYTHNKLIDILTNDESHETESYYTENIPLLDTSENIELDEFGNPIYEHKAGDQMFDINGDPIMETIITKTRLCELSEIEIVDI